MAKLVQAAGDRHLGPDVIRPGATRKDDGSLVTQIDTAIQNDVFEVLEQNWPHIHKLGEEMTHGEHCQVLSESGGSFWVLDPLDGTTNFVGGFPFYGVSLALVSNYQTKMAVIYDPVRRELFSAEQGKGTRMNGRVLKGGSETAVNQCIANIDFKRLTRDLSVRLVHYPPYRSQRNLGSCVLEWCWLAANRFQIYLHGGEKMWDYAAGLLILDEAGGYSSNFDGERVDCSHLGKKPIIAASNRTLYQAWYNWVFGGGHC